jgi:hypothetical protein
LGFSTPESAWLAGPLRPWLENTLTRPKYLEEIVELRAVAHLLDQHRRGHESQGSAAVLFRLANYEAWARVILEDRVTVRVGNAAVR